MLITAPEIHFFPKVLGWSLMHGQTKHCSGSGSSVNTGLLYIIQSNNSTSLLQGQYRLLARYVSCIADTYTYYIYKRMYESNTFRACYMYRDLIIYFIKVGVGENVHVDFFLSVSLFPNLNKKESLNWWPYVLSLIFDWWLFITIGLVLIFKSNCKFSYSIKIYSNQIQLEIMYFVNDISRWTHGYPKWWTASSLSCSCS